MPQQEFFDDVGSSGTATIPELENRPKILPPFNVVLIDDDDHTYAYVIKMLRELCQCDSCTSTDTPAQE